MTQQNSSSDNSLSEKASRETKAMAEALKIQQTATTPEEKRRLISEMMERNRAQAEKKELPKR